MEACRREEEGESGLSAELIRLMNKEHVAYVLITCAPPTESGQMHVEMTYDGDPVLASYLIESAQGFFEESH